MHFVNQSYCTIPPETIDLFSVLLPHQHHEAFNFLGDTATGHFFAGVKLWSGSKVAMGKLVSVKLHN